MATMPKLNVPNLEESKKKLTELKSQVQQGKLTLDQYLEQANPLIKSYAEVDPTLQSNYSDKTKFYNWLRSEGFTKTGPNNTAIANIPFTPTEFAKLPENVLPTEADVASGKFDYNLLPIQRYQTPTAPEGGAQPGPTDQGLPTVDTSLPTTIDLRTDRGQVETEAQRQARTLQDTLLKQQDVYQKAIDDFGGRLQGVPDQYIQEGELQKQKLMDLAGQQRTSREQSLKDLASLLTNQASQNFERSIPQLAEQANTAGVFRSTGYGNALAREQARLQQDLGTQLGLQGLSDREAYLGAEQDALSRALGFRNTALDYGTQTKETLAGAKSGALANYAQGLADVANTKAGLQTSGLQRQFSLDDYTKQLNLARELAAAQVPTSAPSAKGSSALSGGLGGAGIGAQVGGPWGAAIGGGIGAIAGGRAGSK